MNKICSYGCGKPAEYQFKNGKWCCEKDYRKCLGVRKNNSEAQKGKKKSKETRKKLSLAKKGENHYMFGKSHSKETRKKQSEAMKGKKLSKEHKEKIGLATKNPSKETRKKMRLLAIKRIEKNKGQIYPNYNPKACKVIEEYGIKNGYNFQHAENGREFYIPKLGYWVDGYDKEKNVVIEVDEKAHFDSDGNLLEKDIRRQKEIEKFLGCKFIRIKIVKRERISNHGLR